MSVLGLFSALPISIGLIQSEHSLAFEQVFGNNTALEPKSG